MPHIFPTEIEQPVGDAAGEGRGRDIDLTGDGIGAVEAHGGVDGNRRV